MKNNFFMMPNDVFLLMLRPSELAVLSYLVKCSNKMGISYPSIHTIAEACFISDNTVRKALRKLEARSIISISGGYTYSKFGKPQSTSYVYSVNPDFYELGFARDNAV